MTKCGVVSLTSVFLYLFLNLQTAFAQTQDNTKVDDPDKVAGQFMMIGISGTSLTAAEKRHLREIKPGGVILFRRNISSFQQLAKLNLELQKISLEVSGRPLLISTDQEGGRVARLQISPAMPSALAMGMTNNEKVVEAVSLESGRLLKALGINMNLAPVLDVLIDHSHSFIGERSFGVDAQTVAHLGSSFAQGQLRAGVIPTSKHFPGAGMIQKDPHVEKVNAGQLNHLDLSPFRNFAQIFPSAMMMSHASYPSLDSSGLPATYSSKIMKDLLRKEWGYRGLIMTDDILMKGAGVSSSLADSSLQSLQAGADMVMVSWGMKTQSLVKRAIQKGIQSNSLFNIDMVEKIQRIDQVKKLIQVNLNPRFPSSDLAVYESKKMVELDNKILEINLYRDLSNVLVQWNSQFTLVTSDMNFIWAFERAVGKKVSYIKPEEVLKSHSKEQRGQNDIIFVPIHNKKTFYQISSLPTSIKKRVVLLLLSQPMPLSQKSYLSVVRLFHPHKELARKLGEHIRQRMGLAQNETD